MKTTDPEILEAAIIGYQQQLETINAKIAEIRRRLAGRSEPVTSISNGTGSTKKHHISAEGRARIAAAQRRRWAAAKKNQAG